MKKMSILLAAVMLAGSLAGCGGGEKKTEGGGSNTIKWYVPFTKQADQAVVMDELNKKIEDKLNVKLDLIPIDSGSYAEKMNLIISSKEDYDLCFTSNWLNTYDANVHKNAFLKIDDYIDKMPELKAAVPDYVWEAGKLNGSLYGVPNYQVMFKNIKLQVKADYAEKYHLNAADIKDFKDLEPFLKQIKDNEPNMIPFNPTWTPAGIYYQTFGGQLYLSKNATKDNFEVLPIYELPEQLDYWNLMHEWYQSGYIASDILTNNDIPDSQIVVCVANYKPGAEAVAIAEEGKKPVYIELAPPFVDAGASQNTMTAVSANSKNPQLALDVVQYLYTDVEAYNLLCKGIEGVHYKKTDDGRIESLSDKYVPDCDWMVGNQFNAYISSNSDSDIWDKTKEINETSKYSDFVGFSFDLSNVKNEITSISSIVSEYEKFLNAGVEDPTTHIENYKKKLQSAGIDKVKTELERQLKEFANK